MSWDQIFMEFRPEIFCTHHARIFGVAQILMLLGVIIPISFAMRLATFMSTGLAWVCKNSMLIYLTGNFAFLNPEVALR